MGARNADDPEHLRRAEDLTKRILDKAEKALAPLELELTLLKMPSHFQSIIFDAVARRATLLAEAQRSKA